MRRALTIPSPVSGYRALQCFLRAFRTTSAKLSQGVLDPVGGVIDDFAIGHRCTTLVGLVKWRIAQQLTNVGDCLGKVWEEGIGFKNRRQISAYRGRRPRVSKPIKQKNQSGNPARNQCNVSRPAPGVQHLQEAMKGCGRIAATRLRCCERRDGERLPKAIAGFPGDRDGLLKGIQSARRIGFKEDASLGRKSHSEPIWHSRKLNLGHNFIGDRPRLVARAAQIQIERKKGQAGAISPIGRMRRAGTREFDHPTSVALVECDLCQFDECPDKLIEVGSTC